MSAPRQPAPPPQPAADARPLVDAMLDEAARRRASDVHVEPTAIGYEIRYRVDGLLETVARHDTATGRSIVGRLMVMGHLLTYRVDVPQEGRVSTVLAAASAHGSAAGSGPPTALELRLAVMPTTHGLRAAVRMPAELVQPRSLGDLGLPRPVLEGLHKFAAADAGMLVVTGPAGSGKTTTIYALLEHIARTSPGVSIIALEDPVERDLPGVTQIEVSPFGELTYERSLRSILRQDPQVLALGEIRDAATASLALQAALSGHRLVCTLHASSPGGAIARLFEMGMEPYQITSAVFGVLSQRLLRRRSEAEGQYRGRVPVAELAVMNAELREAVLRKADAETLTTIIARQLGHVDLRGCAQELLQSGLTGEEEVRRVFGAIRPA
jgi:general secretion pathway protein E